MYLKCRRTKEIIYLSDNEKEFITVLFSRFDIEKSFRGFLQEDMNYSQCLETGWMIEKHIKENKIFESLTGGITKPVIVDDNKIKSKAYQPLSLEKLSFLSEVATFMQQARSGIELIPDVC